MSASFCGSADGLLPQLSRASAVPESVTGLLVTVYAALVIVLTPAFGLVVAGRVAGGIAHALSFSVSSACTPALVPERLQGRALVIAAG